MSDAAFSVIDLDMDDNSIQSYRIDQALRGAGIDINMLNIMDKARIFSALWADNILNEDGNSALSMFGSTTAVADALTLTDAERNERNGVKTDIYGSVVEAFDSISEEEKAKLKEQAAANISYINIEQSNSSVVMSLTAVMGLILGESRFNSLAAQAEAKRVHEHLKNEITGLGVSLSGDISAIDVASPTQDIATSFTGKPPGFESWTAKVEAEKNPQNLASVQEKPVRNHNPENWQEFVIDRAAMEAHLAHESSKN